jgi:hypothetical protein
MHKASPQTKNQALALLKKLGLLKPRRIIIGEEREQVLTMLRLTPSEVGNNQQLWSETWQIGNITYEHITGDGVDELMEIINNE